MPMKYRQLDNAAKAKGAAKSSMQPSKYPPKKKVAGAKKKAAQMKSKKGMY
jgi:hypothetical protein